MNRADLLRLQIEVDTAAARKAIDQFESKVKEQAANLKNPLNQMAAGFSSIQAALAGLGVGLSIAGFHRLMDEAQHIQEISKGFEYFSKQAGFSADTIKRMGAAAGHAVSDIDLMERANQALQLGLVKTDDEMVEIIGVASRLGNVVGVSAAQAIEIFTTGLARMSDRSLVQLGITVDSEKAFKDYAQALGTTADKLTEAEKRQAFMNAAMVKGKEGAKAMGEEVTTLSSLWITAWTAMSNVTKQAIKDTNEFRLPPAFRPHPNEFKNWGVANVPNPADLGLGVTGMTPDQLVRAMETQKDVVKDLIAEHVALAAAEKKAREEAERLFNLPYKSPAAGLLGTLEAYHNLPKLQASTFEVGMSGDRMKEVEQMIANYTALIPLQQDMASGALNLSDALDGIARVQRDLNASGLEWNDGLQAQAQALLVAGQAAEISAEKYHLLEGALQASADALWQMAVTGEFSAKSLVNAIARQVFGQLSALAIKDVILGMEQLAMAVASAASYDYGAAALHTQSAHLFFATAAKAGIGAGVALAVGAATGSGSGGGSSQQSSGSRVSQSAPQEVHVYVDMSGSGIFENETVFTRRLADNLRQQLDRVGSRGRGD